MGTIQTLFKRIIAVVISIAKRCFLQNTPALTNQGLSVTTGGASAGAIPNRTF